MIGMDGVFELLGLFLIIGFVLLKHLTQINYILKSLLKELMMNHYLEQVILAKY